MSRGARQEMDHLRVRCAQRSLKRRLTGNILMSSTCPQVRHTSGNRCNFLAPGLAINICGQVYLFDVEPLVREKSCITFTHTRQVARWFHGAKRDGAAEIVPRSGSPRLRPQGQ